MKLDLRPRKFLFCQRCLCGQMHAYEIIQTGDGKWICLNCEYKRNSPLKARGEEGEDG